MKIKVDQVMDEDGMDELREMEFYEKVKRQRKNKKDNYADVFNSEE